MIGAPIPSKFYPVPKMAEMTRPTETANASGRETWISGGYCVRDGVCYVDLIFQLNFVPDVGAPTGNIQMQSVRQNGFPLPKYSVMPLFDVYFGYYNSTAQKYDLKALGTGSIFVNGADTTGTLCIVPFVTFDASDISNHTVRCYVRGQYEVN